jgi:hypothetical protein
MQIEIPEGVQQFNFWTISIMARLWEEFPRPLHFYPTRTSVHVTRDSTEAGEPFGPEGQAQIFKNTITWLIEEGFLRGVANAAAGSYGVSLTTRGFSVLNEVPHSVATQQSAPPQKPLGAQMREAAVSQGVAAISSLVQSMLGLTPGH